LAQISNSPWTGKPWNARWFGEQWSRAAEAAGYPWLRARDLRLAFATEASDYGAPTKAISSSLGHSSERVTEKFYIKSAAEHYASQVLRVIEGRRASRAPEKKTGTKTGTTGN